MAKLDLSSLKKQSQTQNAPAVVSSSPEKSEKEEVSLQESQSLGAASVTGSVRPNTSVSRQKISLSSLKKQSQTQNAPAVVSSSEEKEEVVAPVIAKAPSSEYFPNLSIQTDVLGDFTPEAKKEELPSERESSVVTDAIEITPTESLSETEVMDEEAQELPQEKDIVGIETSSSEEHTEASPLVEQKSESIPPSSEYVQEVAAELSKERKGGLMELFSKKKVLMVSMGSMLVLGILGGFMGASMFHAPKASVGESQSPVVSNTGALTQTWVTATGATEDVSSGTGTLEWIGASLLPSIRTPNIRKVQ